MIINYFETPNISVFKDELLYFAVRLFNSIKYNSGYFKINLNACKKNVSAIFINCFKFK